MGINSEVACGFPDVDPTREPDFFVRFMDEGHRIPAIRASKTLIRQRLGLRAGDAVLDVGCGPGISLLEMAEAVGPGGRLAGVNASDTMVTEARRRAASRDFAATFEVGDAQALPFPDGTFDVCHAERLLMHVPDAERTLAEMVRVARPGGRIGVFDLDWDTTIVDGPDKETTRTIVRTFSDALRRGWIGRQLPRLFTGAGPGRRGGRGDRRLPHLCVRGVAARRTHDATPGGGRAHVRAGSNVVGATTVGGRARRLPGGRHRVRRRRHEAGGGLRTAPVRFMTKRERGVATPDETAIEQLLGELIDAWNRGDASAYGARSSIGDTRRSFVDTSGEASLP